MKQDSCAVRVAFRHSRLVPNTKLIGCASVCNGVPAQRFPVVRVSTFKLSNTALCQPEAQNLLNDIQALTIKEHTIKVESGRHSNTTHVSTKHRNASKHRCEAQSFMHARTGKRIKKGQEPSALKIDLITFPLPSTASGTSSTAAATMMLMHEYIVTEEA